MSKVSEKTGEVYVSSIEKFVHETEGREAGSMIIQNKDFAWSDEVRDFIVVDGDKEDRQAYIDSFADECGVYNVLKKYAITGDASVLNRKEGFYGDISDLPVDELNPAMMQQRAQSSLDALNQALGTDYTAEQLSGLSSEQLAELLAGIIAKKSESPVVEEDKKEG